jgi:uncharacterized MnhB-related membrane protein
MAELFATGRIIDAVLLLVVAEAVFLMFWRSRTGQGIGTSSVIAYLASGFMLMLAVRFALTGAWWGWVAACMLGALVAHLVDLRGRWQG